MRIITDKQTIVLEMSSSGRAWLRFDSHPDRWWFAPSAVLVDSL